MGSCRTVALWKNFYCCYGWHCSSPVCQQKFFWRATVLQLVVWGTQGYMPSNFSKVELEYLENQMNLKYHAKSFHFVFYAKYLELFHLEVCPWSPYFGRHHGLTVMAWLWWVQLLLHPLYTHLMISWPIIWMSGGQCCKQSGYPATVR